MTIDFETTRRRRQAVNGSPDPQSLAKLQVENEKLRFEQTILRQEVSRLSNAQRALQAQYELAETERQQLLRLRDAIESSRPWRLIQAVRGFFGRRW